MHTTRERIRLLLRPSTSARTTSTHTAPTTRSRSTRRATTPAAPPAPPLPAATSEPRPGRRKRPTLPPKTWGDFIFIHGGWAQKAKLFVPSLHTFDFQLWTDFHFLFPLFFGIIKRYLSLKIYGKTNSRRRSS